MTVTSTAAASNTSELNSIATQLELPEPPIIEILTPAHQGTERLNYQPDYFPTYHIPLAMDLATESTMDLPARKASKILPEYLGRGSQKPKQAPENQRAVTLLDFPVEILQLIVKEVRLPFSLWTPLRLDSR